MERRHCIVFRKMNQYSNPVNIEPGDSASHSELVRCQHVGLYRDAWSQTSLRVNLKSARKVVLHWLLFHVDSLD
jgi:hypothetical protein